MQRLKRLHTADGRQLSPRLKAEIVRELQRLELVLIRSNFMSDRGVAVTVSWDLVSP
jgi:hypothetical protein